MSRSVFPAGKSRVEKRTKTIPGESGATPITVIIQTEGRSVFGGVINMQYTGGTGKAYYNPIKWERVSETELKLLFYKNSTYDGSVTPTINIEYNLIF